MASGPKPPHRRVLAKLRQSAPQNFKLVAGDIDDGVVGGFIRSDGFVFFMEFSEELKGHTDAIAADDDPQDWLGGFSAGIKAGRVSWFLFRSAINHPDICPHRTVQN